MVRQGQSIIYMDLCYLKTYCAIIKQCTKIAIKQPQLTLQKQFAINLEMENAQVLKYT